MSGSQAIERLDRQIQRWIWDKGWTTLRDAQERAVDPILEAKADVIIAAATAAGKTEAAFLPILTHIISRGEELGLVIYISPLKALINDQWGRLDQLCDSMDIPVYPWHGDIGQSIRQKFFKTPRGVLLITPEAMEAMFVRRGSQLSRLFAEVTHIVVDELHAFIGSDRGKQLQSLLYRIEQASDRRIPRVGLSATLGDMKLAAEFLRQGEADHVEMIVSSAVSATLKIQVRGYKQVLSSDEILKRKMKPLPEPESVVAKEVIGGPETVADHLFKTLRGSNNLVFPNRRADVELYTNLLREHCEKEFAPVEFWPHHGSLSRNIREETERALKSQDRPATAICTNTLELGIDIGAVKSVAQIGPGPSVASLRQRLGRSGRREGESATLRNYALEGQICTGSGYGECLRLRLVQSIAMIELLLQGWFEPPKAKGLHLSTLVQQVLSTIAQYSGRDAANLYRSLVQHGAFKGMTIADFSLFLRSLASHDLIVQESSGLLLLGGAGERFVDSYEFYTAFVTEDEWKIVSDGRVLGTLPITTALVLGMRIVFAGRRWVVTSVDQESQSVSVQQSAGGAPPIFESGHPNVHGIVRSKMKEVLKTVEAFSYLDDGANHLLQEARAYFKKFDLAQTSIQNNGSEVDLFTWAGDDANDAIVIILQQRGFKLATNCGSWINVERGAGTTEALFNVLRDIDSLDEQSLTEMLLDAQNLTRGKWDWALPERLLRENYVSQNLSFEGAKLASRAILAEIERF